jgi:hypothetical protein
MADAADEEKRTANDNLYRMRPATSRPAHDFDPFAFEKLMEQRLSEGKQTDATAPDVFICHVY